MPMWWNEKDGIETVLTFCAPARPAKIVGGIFGMKSTAPVRRLCASTSSFWNRIQVTFFAAGVVPHQSPFRVISIDWPCFQLTNLYGPVPIGWGLVNRWICDADMPCQMCCGRIGIARPGLNACGFEKFKTSVVESGASAEVR